MIRIARRAAVSCWFAGSPVASPFCDNHGQNFVSCKRLEIDDAESGDGRFVCDADLAKIDAEDAAYLAAFEHELSLDAMARGEAPV